MGPHLSVVSCDVRARLRACERANEHAWAPVVQAPNAPKA